MVGFFDSGVGGLSILREFRKLLPNEEVVYFGDTAHLPYGSRSAEEITDLSLQAVDFLLRQKPKVIVIACNTATSVAIQTLRRRYPTLPIVGVVPVVKTLAQHTQNKRVAVCAMAATLSSNIYAQLKKEFAPGIEVLELAQPEWVMFIEAGELNSPKVLESVNSVAKRVHDFGADSLALGCTHFDFLLPTLVRAMPRVAMYDSGSAVARHVVRVLTANHALTATSTIGIEKFIVSGDPISFSSVASRLLGREIIAQSQRAIIDPAPQ